MYRDPGSEDMLRRAAWDNYVGLHRPLRAQEGPEPPQEVPINIYETEEDVVVVAPMPGVEPEDIDIQMQGSRLTLRAALRGPGQQDRRYLLHEWTYGPYERSVDLPVQVDTQGAHASHGNGVLVLSLPKASSSRTVRVSLHQKS